jgi:protein subunit release factor A
MLQYLLFLRLSTGFSQPFFALTDMIALQKENGDDPDMAEMIASELESLSNELAELEERLTVGMAFYISI